MIDRPYFMTKPEWYRFDFDKKCFVLTDKATAEAKKSYEDFVKTLSAMHKG